eukprot:COSAG05_NODE_468_length_9525_cov_30.402292_8_plen_82_part_00
MLSAFSMLLLLLLLQVILTSHTGTPLMIPIHKELAGTITRSNANVVRSRRRRRRCRRCCYSSFSSSSCRLSFVSRRASALY